MAEAQSALPNETADENLSHAHTILADAPDTSNLEADQSATDSTPAASHAASSSGPVDAASLASSAARPAQPGPYAQFVDQLRDPSAQAVVAKIRGFVNEFPSSLTRQQGARRIHDFVTNTVPQLLAIRVFADNVEQQRFAMEGLEKFVTMKLYKVLFRHAASDVREDERVDQRIKQRAAQGAERLLPPGLPFDSRGALASAAQELTRVDQYRAPRDKISCFVAVHRTVEGVAVGALQRRRRVDADEAVFIQSILAAIIVQASPPHFFSNLEFSSAFRHPSMLSSEDRACLQDWAAALSVVNGATAGETLGGVAGALGGGVAGAVLAAIGGGGAFARAPAREEEAVVPWLASAGVSLRFAESSSGELLVSEVDELLDEYHRMVTVLRTLAEQRSDNKVMAVAS